MQHTLDKFMKIITTLLHDESDHPVAQFVPSQELFDTIDLSLQKEGIPEEEFDQVLTDLVLKSPRTATNAFFNQLFAEVPLNFFYKETVSLFEKPLVFQPPKLA